MYIFEFPAVFKLLFKLSFKLDLTSLPEFPAVFKLSFILSFKLDHFNFNVTRTSSCSIFYSSVLQKWLWFFFGATMSHKIILDDLRGRKITPARSNSTYIVEVQEWFWRFIAQSGLPSNCQTLQVWVAKDSEKITDYLKRIWEDHNGRYEAILRHHKEFLAKVVEIPGMLWLFSVSI